MANGPIEVCDLCGKAKCYRKPPEGGPKYTPLEIQGRTLIPKRPDCHYNQTNGGYGELTPISSTPREKNDQTMALTA